MRQTKKLLTLTLVVLLSFSIYGCKSDKYDLVIPEKVSGNLNLLKAKLNVIQFEFQDSLSNDLVKIESSVKDSILNSTLYLKTGKNWIEINKFNIILKDGYKNNMNLFVKDKASRIARENEFSKLSRVTNILDAIPEKLFNKVGKKIFYEESTQSLFYHLAILNSAKRAISLNSNDCNCMANGSYIKEGTPFTCLEDKYVSANDVLEVANKIFTKRTFHGKEFNAAKTVSYLKSQSGRRIAASEVKRILNVEMESFFQNTLSESQRESTLNEYKRKQTQHSNLGEKSSDYDPEWNASCAEDSTTGGPWLCLLMGITWGYECGCCGNYDWPCVCCDFACLLHDQACVDCDKWWCGPGCIPGPCD